MLGRILRIIFLIGLTVFFIKYLLGKRQKRALNEKIRLLAWVTLGVFTLAFILHLWLGVF